MKKRRKCSRFSAVLLLAVFLAAFALTSCREISALPESSSPVSSKANSSAGASSTASSSPGPVSELPSSSEPLPSQAESQTVSDILSQISQANTSSKQPSSQTASKQPSSSQAAASAPPSSTPSDVEFNLGGDQSAATNPSEMKAVWISYLEFQSFAGSTESAFTAKVAQMYDTAVSMGLNTVIVQVRPYGDSIYPSSLFPWSKTVSGQMGQPLGYDPLAILVKEAHARNLSFHAWVNPYRTMTDEEMAQVSGEYAIKRWYDSSSRSDYMILSQGRWWLQPGNAEVQKLIISGIEEIVRNYQVDGIHFDDYFYNETPATYGDTTAQAKANTTALVRGAYQAIKAIRPSVQFGISPQGGFRENSSLPNSDINNMSTDLALWCSASGYIDYVMPQIYWEYTHPTQPFTMTLQKWEGFVTEPNVALYVGLAPYKLTDEVILQQIADIAASSKSSGYCLFRYDFIGGLM